jgi:hypothetical protein
MGDVIGSHDLGYRAATAKKRKLQEKPEPNTWPDCLALHGKRRSLGKISVNYLCIPFSEHFEQPMSIAQHVDRVLLVCRFDGIF